MGGAARVLTFGKGSRTIEQHLRGEKRHQVWGGPAVISPTGATLRPDEGAAAMPKGNREAKKPKKEKPKTSAAAASAKGTGSAPKK